MATLQQSGTSRILMAVAKGYGSPLRHPHAFRPTSLRLTMIDHGASIVIVSAQLAKHALLILR
jgi:hypothetical protein